jgi:hypothetical protein
MRPQRSIALKAGLRIRFTAIVYNIKRCFQDLAPT